MLENKPSFILSAAATTADGYTVRASKTIQILSEHTGGTADCTHKAKCEVCGEEYGDVLGHKMKHTEAKAVTTEVDGNIEYWHCGDCDKYFSDKDGKTEITLADTVVAKLTPAPTPEPTPEPAQAPDTGDEANAALWLALLALGTLALAAVRRKKNAK